MTTPCTLSLGLSTAMATASSLVVVVYFPREGSSRDFWRIIASAGFLAAPYLAMGLMAFIGHRRGDEALSRVAAIFTVVVACPGALILRMFPSDLGPGGGLMTLLMLLLQGILTLTAIIVGLVVGFTAVGPDKGGLAKARPDEGGAS
jgi:hypothetical protein